MRALRPIRPLVVLSPLLLTSLASACVAARGAPEVEGGAGPDLAWIEGLHWREVGPYRGGRSAAVCGVPGRPREAWFGACGGGVWRTRDGGESWENVSDGTFGGSIGAVAVAPSDPNVVYVGGGEKTVRGNVSHGDGVWRSTDGGRTWTHVGLADTRHVPRIRVHPSDPDTVYVAALGHLFGPNEERGVFRSHDGGESWERVLYVNDSAGAIDLAMDPTNPRILYASFWRVRRTPWSLESGGEGSGIWKSTDGGDTWTELTGNPGLPEPPLGISGISVSATNPDNLYAIVEAQEGGVFRSRDGGATWRRVNAERKLRQRAWYYTRIYADPADEDVVYVLNVRFHRSKDGGKTFEAIPTPHGDNHDLWIDPDDPQHLVEANDGGANVSFDGGRTWSRQSNQPTAQMYRVSIDDAFPYRLLGGQQDNSAVRIRSRSLQAGSIGVRDWEPTAGGESGHIVAKPGEPDVVFGGSYGGYLVRLGHRTGDRRRVDVWPEGPMGQGAGELRYRFQWNFPIFFSPHDPDVLYAAANVLFRSTDEGESWEAISPDLTRADPETLGPSGGPITKDNTSVEYYATIFAAFESPHEKGVLWTGSDEGLVHLSRDGGATWADVTPPDLPERTMINALEPHPFAPGGCYLAGTRYKLDDFAPYLFVTTDYGATWRRIDAGLPREEFTRVLRADPERPGLLYAGTERGVWVSFDDGESWSSLQLDLPIVPITDLAVAHGDLVAATQGRGYWILDDLSVLRQLDPQEDGDELRLYTPRRTPRVVWRRDEEPGDAGTNPPAGVLFSYVLPADLAEDAEVRLEILEEDGSLVRAFTPKPAEGTEPEPLPPDVPDDPRRLEVGPGLHRFAWDLTYPSAEGFEGMVLWHSDLSGPRALPGTYRARLTAGEDVREVSFEIVPDPRSNATREALEAQFRFLLEVRDELTRVHRAIRWLRGVRDQLRELEERLGSDERFSTVVARARDLSETLSRHEEALHQTKAESRQDPLNFPIRLDDKLAGLLGVVRTGDHPPTAQAEAVRAELVTAIEPHLAAIRRLREEEVPAFERLAREAGVPVILPSPPPTARR